MLQKQHNLPRELLPYKIQINMPYLKKCVLFLTLMTLLSCGGIKGVEGTSTANSSLAVKAIIASHDAATPNFNTLAARVQVEFEDKNTSQSITTSLRIQKDEIIWIKASILGITLAKVLITPDRVAFYETINNQYFDGDFALLSNMLGTEIDFQKAQDILLGQAIFDLGGNAYTSEVKNNLYHLKPKKEFSNFIHMLTLYPNSFKVASEVISQPNENRQLTVLYGPHVKTEGQYFPSKVNIEATERTDKTKIDLTYKKIDLNVSVSFPFKIPSGYDQIKLR